MRVSVTVEMRANMRIVEKIRVDRRVVVTKIQLSVIRKEDQDLVSNGVTRVGSQVSGR